MNTKVCGKILPKLAALLMILVCLMNGALAYERVEATPVPLPEGATGVVVQLYGQSTDVLRLKDKLYQRGYYPSYISGSSLTTTVLDDITMAAVKECCIRNNLPFADYGILYDTWNAILGDQIVDLNVRETPAPTEEPFHLLYWGEQSDSVRAIQLVLQQLGYGLNMQPGLYDQALRDALDEFCRNNGIVYDQNASSGITVDLQKMILEGKSFVGPATPVPETPTPAPTATVAPSFGEKIRNHFTGSTNMLGMKVPNLVLWIVSLALIAGCIFLIFIFFINDEKSEGGRRNRDNRPTNFGEAPVIGMGRIEFVILYDGRETRYRCNIQERALLIGRGVGDFPLDAGDGRISRKHCEIYYLNRSLMLRDYSSNGTSVNGRIISHGEHILSSGDRIVVGNHQITIFF